jgi:N-hydroxyarylamine O-acetyltransferase
MTSSATAARQNSETTTSGSIASVWEVERLDVDAYLSRIGYHGPLEPTAEILAELHRAHAESIPFENLGVVLGHGISLDIGDIQDKLIRSRRGGYCYEHNLLFSALLERFGFEVTRLVARVNPDRPGPRTHMTLNVTIGGRVWLADVGFGAALLEPIPLVDGAESRQGEWTNGVRRDADGLWRLRTRDDDAWNDLYAFTGEPQHPNDYRVYNHFTSTHPASPFVGQLVAIRLTPTERLTLRGTELTTVRPTGIVSQRQVPIPEMTGVLRKTFGIALDDANAATLTAFLEQTRPTRQEPD